jgi:hypothetical protein
MVPARIVGRAFSPLDEELSLLPGELTPRLQEQVTRLGTWMPFARARVELEALTGARVSAATVRRVTEAAGAAYVAVQDAEVARLEQAVPPAPPGAERMLASVDGAMVPLVGGEWKEVKTLALGVVREKTNRKGERVIETEELSYFSRYLPAEEFTRAALVETHRRGLENAQAVCGVCDGAEWQQGFLDHHCPSAIRILDFPHAAGRLRETAHAAYGEGSTKAVAWLETQCHELKHGAATQVLLELEALSFSSPQAQEKQAEHAAYLRKRLPQLRYAEFQAQGFPIGSGCVESAHKVVVEARLKQAGMHWAPEHVNPMVALRNAACNSRWEEAWSAIVTEQQAARRRDKLARHVLPSPAATAPPVTPVAVSEVPVPPPTEGGPPPATAFVRKPRYIPPPDHPWRKFRINTRETQKAAAGTRAKK